MIDNILKYFPHLTDAQKANFLGLYGIYESWNQKINVLSRKDFENFYLHHVLHSLSIAKLISFKDGTKLLDIGAGGGFPSVPLAIMFPNVSILAVDSIQKKTKVIEAVKEDLNLTNLTVNWGRAEEVIGQYDFILSRAVAPLGDLMRWSRGKLHPISFNRLNNGLLTLKGGDLKEEIKLANRKTVLTPISEYFSEDFFETKFITYTKL